jgi:hypothetical protein
LFVGFVDRPRLFAFCWMAPGVRFRCNPTTRVGVLDFNSFFSCATSLRVHSFPLLARLHEEIERVFKANYSVYGARKVWRQLHRERIVIGRDRVARLMRQAGLRGVRGGIS